MDIFYDANVVNMNAFPESSITGYSVYVESNDTAGMMVGSDGHVVSFSYMGKDFGDTGKCRVVLEIPEGTDVTIRTIPQKNAIVAGHLAAGFVDSDDLNGITQLLIDNSKNYCGFCKGECAHMDNEYHQELRFILSECGEDRDGTPYCTGCGRPLSVCETMPCMVFELAQEKWQNLQEDSDDA